MNVQDRLNELLKKQNLSRYRLAKNSGIPEETLTNIFKRGSIPTIPTLEMICKGLNISLSEFFAEDDMIECSPELMEMRKSNTEYYMQVNRIHELISST